MLTRHSEGKEMLKYKLETCFKNIREEVQKACNKSHVLSNWNTEGHMKVLQAS